MREGGTAACNYAKEQNKLEDELKKMVQLAALCYPEYLSFGAEQSKFAAVQVVSILLRLTGVWILFFLLSQQLDPVCSDGGPVCQFAQSSVCFFLNLETSESQ